MAHGHFGISHNVKTANFDQSGKEVAAVEEATEVKSVKQEKSREELDAMSWDDLRKYGKEYINVLQKKREDITEELLAL